MPRGRPRTRTTTRSSSSRRARVLKAEIGRFDGDMHNIHFSAGDTVQVLLTKAGISLGEGESINDERGNEVQPSDEAKNNKNYYITGNYKQG